MTFRFFVTSDNTEAVWPSESRVSFLCLKKKKNIILLVKLKKKI